MLENYLVKLFKKLLRWTFILYDDFVRLYFTKYFLFMHV